ncbi:hypothetical protein [Vreelandella azerica]|nr:hypothetical protein [Halomonas azerica]
MTMVPPPFQKGAILMLFVLVDGWHLVGSLAENFSAPRVGAGDQVVS